MRVYLHQWYIISDGTFKPQTQNRGGDRTERILQAEEQILERGEQGLDPYHVQNVQA